jgi:hypothetical protein
MAKAPRTVLWRKTVYNKMTSPGKSAAMAKVRVGLVGCGFVAELHMHAYRRLYGLDAQVTAAAARGDHVLDFARKHRIPVHEGGGEPQRIARRPCCPVVDDGRRLAHPHGVSPAFDGALSQTGGGAGAWRGHCGIGRDRRCRQCRGLPAAAGAYLHQGKSRPSKIGGC